MGNINLPQQSWARLPLESKVKTTSRRQWRVQGRAGPVKIHSANVIAHHNVTLRLGHTLLISAYVPSLEEGVAVAVGVVMVDLDEAVLDAVVVSAVVLALTVAARMFPTLVQNLPRAPSLV